MKIYRTNILIETKVDDSNNVLGYKSEYAQRSNEGKIIKIGVEVSPDEFIVGSKVFFPGYDSIPIEGTGLVLIDASSIMAASDEEIKA